jgi:hypothetical protein
MILGRWRRCKIRHRIIHQPSEQVKCNETDKSTITHVVGDTVDHEHLEGQHKYSACLPTPKNTTYSPYEGGYVVI